VSNLNPRQLQAVRYTDSPLLVLAGAGSGKTSVITRKIAWLHSTLKIPANNIFAVTFTNKAAREMRVRARELLGAESAEQLNIATFHRLGLGIIASELEHLPYRKGFSIFTAEDSLNLIAELSRLSSARDRSRLYEIQQRISDWKTELVTPAMAASLGEEAAIFAAYEQNLQAYNALDFDDLIVRPLMLLQARPGIREKWQQAVRYLLVDEYQDTNNSQYELIKLLVGENTGLTVVGDDDQSIYTWRGARPENLQTLARDFPTLEVVKLEQNYRSTDTILKAANALIANNPHLFEKRLWSEHGQGELIRVLDSDSEKHEAERIAAAIHHHKLMNQTRHSDYAILFRSNYQARELETALRELRIPYVLTGGLSFFDRTEIKDAFAYLRLIANPLDDTAYLRVVNTPRRQIGPTTLARLGEYAGQRGNGLLRSSIELGLAQTISGKSQAALRAFGELILGFHERAESGDPVKLVEEMFDELDFDNWLKEQSKDSAQARRRQENLAELVAWIGRLAQKAPNQTLVDIVNRLALLGMLDKDDDGDQNSVALMTLHSAKGLEFPYVYIAGVEEGILPHQASLEQGAIEEERRLAYVGITRARRELTLCYARRRKRVGQSVDCEPSRFLSEIPEQYLSWKQRTATTPEEKKALGNSYLENMRNLLQNE
jgi:ATP-dependent DNA helicase Rep